MKERAGGNAGGPLERSPIHVAGPPSPSSSSFRPRAHARHTSARTRALQTRVCAYTHNTHARTRTHPWSCAPAAARRGNRNSASPFDPRSPQRVKYLSNTGQILVKLTVTLQLVRFYSESAHAHPAPHPHPHPPPPIPSPIPNPHLFRILAPPSPPPTLPHPPIKLNHPTFPADSRRGGPLLPAAAHHLAAAARGAGLARRLGRRALISLIFKRQNP